MSTPISPVPQVCLGRKAVIHDSRTLKMGAYLGPELPAPPAAVDWTKGQSSWGMMLNDKLGCCTICGCAHAIQLWSNSIGTEVTVPDSVVLSMYEQWDGYKPSDPNTDSGGIELNVLNQWKNQGFSGHQLLAYATVNIHNVLEVQQCINLFGGLYIGVSLPLSAQRQDVWDVVSDPIEGEPGSWGGHCVYVCGYDNYGISVITWGGIKKMTIEFWLKYIDEAYALVGQDFFNAQGVNVEGFNSTQLLTDLAQIH
jgi:hypothetical protein